MSFKISWPQALVVSVAIVALAAVYLFVDASERDTIEKAILAVWALVSTFLHRLLDRKPDSSKAGGAFLVLLVLLAGFGCGGGAPREARTALAVTSAGIAAANAVGDPLYAERADECFETHETAVGYRSCVSRVDALEQGLRSAKSYAESTEAALDAWDAGDGGDSFFAVVPCLAKSLGELLVALEATGLQVPEQLAQVRPFFESFGGSC